MARHYIQHVVNAEDDHCRRCKELIPASGPLPEGWVTVGYQNTVAVSAVHSSSIEPIPGTGSVECIDSIERYVQRVAELDGKIPEGYAYGYHHQGEAWTNA